MRIEISYYADSEQVEGQLFEEGFPDQAEHDLAIVLEILNRQKGLCYRVPQQALMEAFQRTMKERQLFVLQPDVCALVFAKNAKKSSYCGFFRDIPRTHSWDLEAFLAANALPGPGSKIKCVLQRKGPEGGKEVCTYEKESALAQIPGLKYGLEPIMELPMPSNWHDHALTGGPLALIKLCKLGKARLFLP